MSICSIEDCSGAVSGKGWCGKHYRRWQRTGDPLVARAYLTWPDSLLQRREDQPNGCVLFTGATTGRGYGILCVGGKFVLAHRAAYELLVGSIPEGYEIDHECHNADLSCSGGPECLHRRCTNTDHLVPKPGNENRRSSQRALRRVA